MTGSRTSPRLVLASGSPRRTDLLAALGVRHEVVVPPDGAEPPLGDLGPEAHVIASARAKARAVARERPRRLILAADTLVTTGPAPADLLGKPADAEDARRMLRLLSDREHEVWSGLCLAGGRAGEAVAAACTRVRFGPLPEDLIERYVATGEPSDKAGAYAVQGRIASHVAGLQGSWPNVVGLPVELLPELFEAAGEVLAEWQDW